MKNQNIILFSESAQFLNVTQRSLEFYNVHIKKCINNLDEIKKYSNKKDKIYIAQVPTKNKERANKIINFFSETNLNWICVGEDSSINFLAIVDGEPKTLNLKQILEYYLKHQEEVVTRRTQFELDKALKRAHIVEGLLKALDFIDEIINIIRSNKDIKDSKAILMDRFDFTVEQVDAICEMRLRSLSGLEREKLDEEYEKLSAFIEEMQAILGNENRLLQVIKEEFLQTKAKFGDERKTAIVQDEGD